MVFLKNLKFFSMNSNLAFLNSKNIDLGKSGNLPFFKRVHGFFVKTLKFLYPFFSQIEEGKRVRVSSI